MFSRFGLTATVSMLGDIINSPLIVDTVSADAVAVNAREVCFDCRQLAEIGSKFLAPKEEMK